jgi:hypothetical protein
VNEPRTLKVITPLSLQKGAQYTLKVVTQCSAKTHSHMLKELREIKSEFTLTSQGQGRMRYLLRDVYVPRLGADASIG